MIDQAYLVSVQDLKDICGELTRPIDGIEYRLLRTNDERVLVNFNDDLNDSMNLNALCFCFPIVANVPGLTLLHKDSEAGLMVCLSVYTAVQTRRGLYIDPEGELKQDAEGDWNRFWQPLAALLQKEYETL